MCPSRRFSSITELSPVGGISTPGAPQIVDQAKGIVKSGGEWISSLEIENAATLFPGAVITAIQIGRKML